MALAWGVLCRRPALQAQAAARRERRRQAALQKAQGTLLKMRTNVSSGREALSELGKAGGGGGGGRPPDLGAEAQGAEGGWEQHGLKGAGSGGAGRLVEGEAAAAAAAEGKGLTAPKAPAAALPAEGGSYRLVEAGAAEACRGAPGAFDRAERAYGCFAAAVDLLQASRPSCAAAACLHPFSWRMPGQ